QAGDFQRASQVLKRALAHWKNAGPVKVFFEAQHQLGQWEALREKERGLSLKIRDMKPLTFTRRTVGNPAQTGKLEQNIDTLNTMAGSRPDYYGRHELYYTLGLTHKACDQPFAAWKAFRHALALKPAMDLYMPVSRLEKETRLLWQKKFLRTGAGNLLSVALLTLTITWVLQRPGRWFGFRHLAAGGLVAGVWALIFHLWAVNPQHLENARQLVNSDGIYPLPLYLHLKSGTPGSGPLNYLFYYGLGAVTGIFLFSAATGRFKRRLLASGLNLAFGLALCTSLGILFYLKHCQTNVEFYPRKAGVADLTKACLAYPLSDPEPYLLTNPLYYHGLDLSQIDDLKLIEWLKSYDQPAKSFENKNDD
ncbi:MAG: hypothetical protein MI799_16070, partial [Desulfobacterales bacterium]|nr:hypothetical protein [Desulfobacterales bacterium]